MHFPVASFQHLPSWEFPLATLAGTRLCLSLCYSWKSELLKLQSLREGPFNCFLFISEASWSADLFLQLFHLVAQLLDN